MCGLAAILVAGCNHRTASDPPSTALVPTLIGSPVVAVPVPARTPYDGNAKARAIYLEYYALGYGFATSDTASPGCLCTAEGDPERYEAAWNGFFAGKDAGLAASVNNRQPNQAPTTASSGTPPATPPPPHR